MAIIYKEKIDVSKLYNFYEDLLNEIPRDKQTSLLIVMKQFNNVRASIKYRICDLIREGKLVKPFFKEDRSFVVNTINPMFPHYLFTDEALVEMSKVNDSTLLKYVSLYDHARRNIEMSFGKVIRNYEESETSSVSGSESSE